MDPGGGAWAWAQSSLKRVGNRSDGRARSSPHANNRRRGKAGPLAVADQPEAWLALGLCAVDRNVPIRLNHIERNARRCLLHSIPSQVQPHNLPAADTHNGVFGIDLESPAVIAGVVLGTLLLIAGLFVFGYRVLPLVFIVALVATVLDVREVIYQLGKANYVVAFLAIGVALSRLATVLVSGLAWRTSHRQIAPVAVR
jgi:hypothetical protein